MTWMDETTAREEICRIGCSLFERGYVHATAGNISVQLAHGTLITPTDACLGMLAPERLALVRPDGTQASGDRASKTIVLHRRIYDATAATGQAARCIIHTHSTHLVGCSLAAGDTNANAPQGTWPDLLSPITPYFVMKVGHVPHIPYHRPGAPAAAEQVAQAIAHHAAAGHPIRAVMLARLGPNVWHDTPAAAMATLEELEETARLWLTVKPQPPALTAEQIDELRTTFGAAW